MNRYVAQLINKWLNVSNIALYIYIYIFFLYAWGELHFVTFENPGLGTDTKKRWLVREHNLAYVNCLPCWQTVIILCYGFFFSRKDINSRRYYSVCDKDTKETDKQFGFFVFKPYSCSLSACFVIPVNKSRHIVVTYQGFAESLRTLTFSVLLTYEWLHVTDCSLYYPIFSQRSFVHQGSVLQ